MILYDASNIEEPSAGKPHAGICERAVGYLPRFRRIIEERFTIPGSLSGRN